MNEQTNNPLGGFMMDLGKVDTVKPLPASGTYVSTIAKVEIKPSKKNPSDNVLWVTLAIRDAVQSTPSKVTGASATLPPGFEVVEFIPLWEIEKSFESWQVRVAKLYDAAMGTTDADRPTQFDISAIQGRTVVMTIKTEYDENYGADSCRVKKISKLTQ